MARAGSGGARMTRLGKIATESDLASLGIHATSSETSEPTRFISRIVAGDSGYDVWVQTIQARCTKGALSAAELAENLEKSGFLVSLIRDECEPGHSETVSMFHGLQGFDDDIIETKRTIVLFALSKHT